MNEEPDDLPLGWMSVAVGDVTETKVDQQGPVGESEFIYVDISSVDNTAKVISDAKQVPIKGAPGRARQRIKSGDVLVSMTRPNLNAVAKVPQEFDGAIASTGFHVLRSCGVESDWLFAHVQSEAFVGSMSELVRGALYPAVNAKEIRDYKIPLPPLPEQRRIVAKIEALRARSHKAREALEAIPTMLEKFRQSVLAAAFRGELTADWRERHTNVEPASVVLERIRTERRRKWEKAELAKFKAKGKVPKDDSWKECYVEPEPIDDSDLPELPEGWCWASLREIVHGLQQGWSPKCENEATDDPDLWAVIKTTAVQAMSFLPHENKKLPRNLEPAVDLEIREQDLLITRAGPRVRAGVMCLVEAVRQKLILCDKVYRFRADEGITPKYLEIALNSPQCVRAIDRLKTGISDSGVNLTQERFLELSIPVPPIPEQRAVVEKARQFWNTSVSIEITTKDLANNSNTLNQSILAKAFRGELVPQDPNDEPASVLLQRIQAERAADTNGNPARSRRKRTSTAADD